MFGEIARYEYHWWALELEAGKTYAFQTRLPTNFNTRLNLYDDRVYSIAYDYNSGDDGNNLSKIVYTASKDAMSYIRVGGYSSYYDYGSYVLESIPAPVCAYRMASAPARADARMVTESTAPVRFAVTVTNGSSR